MRLPRLLGAMAVLAHAPQLLPTATAEVATMNDAEAVAESVDVICSPELFVDASRRNIAPPIATLPSITHRNRYEILSTNHSSRR